MKGLILFFGKRYPLDDYYQRLCNWQTVDMTSKSDPDLVVDIFSPTAGKEILATLNGNELYDYVVAYNCFLTANQFPTVSKTIMHLAKKLLKLTGVFFYHNYFTYAINYLVLSNKAQDLSNEVGSYQEKEYKVFIDHSLASYDSRILNALLMKEDGTLEKEKFTLLEYALSYALILSMETGFSKYEYLSCLYRPSNAGLALNYTECKKYLTLKFTSTDNVKHRYHNILKVVKKITNKDIF